MKTENVSAKVSGKSLLRERGLEMQLGGKVVGQAISLLQGTGKRQAGL